MFQQFLYILTFLTLSLPYNLQAAEERPKAPPPVLVPAVPSLIGFAGQMSFPLGDGKVVTIDTNANTVKVYDFSDILHPKLISTNQYQAEAKEEKKPAE